MEGVCNYGEFKQKGTEREIYEDLVGRHDYPFLTTCVSASSAVDNALLLYKPVAKHRKNNPVADDYLELAK